MGNVCSKPKKPENTKWKDAESKAVQAPAEPSKEAVQPSAPPVEKSESEESKEDDDAPPPYPPPPPPIQSNKK